MRGTRREQSIQSSSGLPGSFLRSSSAADYRASLLFLLASLVPLPSFLISDEPVDPAKRERRYRERQQLRRIPGRDIEDDQLADDGQQRDQDDGADLYDAVRLLGHE